MSNKNKFRRLGGEFYKPVARREPRKRIDKQTGEEEDYIVDSVRLELGGEAHRADRPTEVKRELVLLEVETLEPEVKAEHGIGVLESFQLDVLPAYKGGGSDIILFSWSRALQARVGLGSVRRGIEGAV